MGMAASQARWISLAARKSNVEYEGQQINQARLALSNQSAELWNQLYDMEVPSPPSTTDFSTTEYTFSDGDATQAITSIRSAEYTDEDGVKYNAYVTYSQSVNEYKGIRNTNSNPQVQYVEATQEGESGYYMIGTKKVTCLNSIDREDNSADSVWPSYQTELDQIAVDWPDTQLAQDWERFKAGDETALDNIYFWTDSSGNVNFASGTSNSRDSLAHCSTDPSASLHSYYADTQETTKEVSKYALIDYDSDGRATAMQLEGSTAVYTLETSTKTDEDAYNDAMNKYYYEQALYDKKVQDINAKTEKIQTEDSTTELRLKQLDTEQNALQTEMDAVKKVISKNVESTFKTFGE